MIAVSCLVLLFALKSEIYSIVFAAVVVIVIVVVVFVGFSSFGFISISLELSTLHTRGFYLHYSCSGPSSSTRPISAFENNSCIPISSVRRFGFTDFSSDFWRWFSRFFLLLLLLAALWLVRNSFLLVNLAIQSWSSCVYSLERLVCEFR